MIAFSICTHFVGNIVYANTFHSRQICILMCTNLNNLFVYIAYAKNMFFYVNDFECFPIKWGSFNFYVFPFEPFII